MTNIILKRITFTLLCLWLLPVYQVSANDFLCESPPERIYLLRHAEKQDYSHDSPLNNEGKRRAESLIEVIGNKPIQAIYTTELTRTIETATPLSIHVKIEIQKIPKDNIDDLLSDICNKNREMTIVVVGHSDTIPIILSKFKLNIETPAYGDLFVIDFKNGKAASIKKRFGGN